MQFDVVWYNAHMSTTNLSEHIARVLPWLDESQKRKFLASEAISLGRGGIQEISAISGMHRNTIAAGVKELNNSDISSQPAEEEKRRIRAKGQAESRSQKQSQE